MWFTRKKKEWCCWHIEELHNGRYDRSLFVFVKPPVPNLWTKHTFWLAFRSVTYDDLVSELPLRVRDDVALTLSSSQRIDYCPWCGRNLSRYYRRRFNELVDPKICEEFETAVETTPNTSH